MRPAVPALDRGRCARAVHSVTHLPPELHDACKADHGYTLESAPVQRLFQVLAAFTRQQQRDFLAFVTGSPNLPVGGAPGAHWSRR